MAYLYLNFVDNLEAGLGSKAWGRDDFYTNSLNEQYEALKPKFRFSLIHNPNLKLKMLRQNLD